MKEDIPKINMAKRKSTVEQPFQSARLPSPSRTNDIGKNAILGLTYNYNTVSLQDYMTENYAYGKTLTQNTLVPNTDGKVYKVKLKLKFQTKVG